MIDFSTLQRIELKEYAANSDFEEYSSIVLDKKDNAFKIVTGSFHDKKDAYEKLSARGLICRKTFERRIFEWALRNAPNNLTAYLMFSTAFSKWKGNNILNEYYIKLLNDIPALNREKIKGDPNSMALDTVQRESVELTEVKPEDAHYTPVNRGKSDSHKLSMDDKYANFNIDKWMDRYEKLKNIKVIPVNTNDTLSKLATPLSFKSTYADINQHFNNITPKSFADPEFLKTIFNKAYIRHTGEAFPEWATFPKYQIMVDNDVVCDITRVELPELLKTAIKNEREGLSKAVSVGANPDDVLTDKQTIQNLQTLYNKAIVRGDKAAQARYKDLLAKTTRAAKKVPGNSLDLTNYNVVKDVKNALSKLSGAISSKDGSYTVKDLNKVIDEKLDTIMDTLNGTSEFQKISDYYKDLQRTQALLTSMKSSLTDDSKIQAIIPFANQLKNTIETIKDRGISPKSSKAAIHQIKAADNDENARRQHQADIYSSPRTAPSNPIRGGDTNSRFFDKLSPYVQRKLHKMTGGHINPNATGDLSVDESAVNQGATTAYLTTPKQPVMHNNGGVIPLAGTIVEEEKQFNPALFDGYRLKPEVRTALLKVADKFKEKLDLELEPVDIYLTGSNANYNYNNASDIDLHLVYNFEEVGIAAEIFSKYLVAQKKVFNSDYDIHIKGIKVEVGAEDINHPLVAGGVYSVLDDEWRITPEQMPEVTDELPPYVTELINEIEKAIQSNDSEVIGNLWKALGALRKESLANEGEFGSGNLMFKKLRTDGYLSRLKDAYYNSASQELSLESLEEI